MVDKQLRNNFDAIANYCENWEENAPARVKKEAALIIYPEDANDPHLFAETAVRTFMEIAYRDCARIAREFADQEEEESNEPQYP